MKINIASLRNAQNAHDAGVVNLVYKEFAKRMIKKGYDEPEEKYVTFVRDALKVSLGQSVPAPIVSLCKTWVALITWCAGERVEIIIYNRHS